MVGLSITSLFRPVAQAIHGQSAAKTTVFVETGYATAGATESHIMGKLIQFPGKNFVKPTFSSGNIALGFLRGIGIGLAIHVFGDLAFNPDKYIGTEPLPYEPQPGFTGYRDPVTNEDIVEPPIENAAHSHIGYHSITAEMPVEQRLKAIFKEFYECQDLLKSHSEMPNKAAFMQAIRSGNPSPETNGLHPLLRIFNSFFTAALSDIKMAESMDQPLDSKPIRNYYRSRSKGLKKEMDCASKYLNAFHEKGIELPDHVKLNLSFARSMLNYIKNNNLFTLKGLRDKAETLIAALNKIL